jgi:hypothetical protein
VGEDAVDGEQDVDPRTNQFDAVLAGVGVGEQVPQARSVLQERCQFLPALVGVAEECGEAGRAALLQRFEAGPAPDWCELGEERHPKARGVLV